jgi:hypothetical protein
MSTTAFQRGAVYTQAEIHHVLGGGVQTYLPRPLGV